MYQFVEDIGLIWLDFMFSYYDDERLVATLDDGNESFARFDMSVWKDALFSCKVDVGASSYWSEISALNTLDRLLELGRINTVQYLERIPDGIIPEKEKLIEELKSNETAQKGSE